MKRIAIIPLILVLVLTAKAQQLAFPEAEGFGRHSVGGRGGTIYEVTNLNDSGPGSLRAAVEAGGPRIVVFRVSGTIPLQSELKIENPYITIAGQTAPGDGICLKNYRLRVKADDVIIRYMRFRLGDDERVPQDGVWISEGKDIILDHCSASWAVDETISVTTASPNDVTIQWCMIVESLNCSVHEESRCHGYGSLISGGWGKGYTYHHNLYAHHKGRNPGFGGAYSYDVDPCGLIFDFRNNVVYNWDQYASNGIGTTGIVRMNFVGNYYKQGPDTNPGDTIAYRQGKNLYNRGYFSDNWMNGVCPGDPWSLLWFSDMNAAEIAAFKLLQPVPAAPVQTDDANTAYGLVLADAGATFPQRDSADVNVINTVINGTGQVIDCVEGDDFYFPTGYAQAATPNTITLDYNEAEEGSRFEEMDIEILSGTGSGQIRTITDYDIITSIATVEPNWIITPDVNSFYGLIVDCTKNAGGYPVLNSIAPPVDTDHDGMPDYWELALCLNPLNPADRNNDRDDDGYTNVEEYLNWLPLGEPIPVIFVDEAATGANDGSSWGDAYTSLQNALAVAQAGKNICVAQGTYKPAGPGGQRTATFQLINGVGIYGGYAGVNEPDPNARDVQLYETILSGDLDGNDTPGLDLYDLWNDPNRAENSYHVVTGSSTEPNAVLDGFTITAGNANGPEPNDRGGGMYNSNGSPTVTNCTFSGNTSSNVGGGIFDYNSSPTLTNCIFAGNSTLGWGGGMRNNSSSPTLINCTFIGNSASSNGGGMHNLNSDSPMITNCTFTGNSASGGGGIWDNNSSPIVTNCTFSGNSASSSGGGMYNIGNSNPTLTNCILWDNSDSGGTDESAQIDGGTPVVNYCCVQGWTGGLGGTGNIGDDPMFVDADGPDNIAGTQDDNLRLSADSNCIDAGDNTAVPADTIDLDNDGNTTELIPFDLNRFSRFIDSCTADTGNGTPPIVDMGAYEFLPSDIYSDGDVDFKDFSRFALYWLDVTCGACGGADLSCDGDVNRDDLRVFTDNWLAGVQ